MILCTFSFSLSSIFKVTWIVNFLKTIFYPSLSILFLHLALVFLSLFFLRELVQYLFLESFWCHSFYMSIPFQLLYSHFFDYACFHIFLDFLVTYSFHPKSSGDFIDLLPYFTAVAKL